MFFSTFFTLAIVFNSFENALFCDSNENDVAAYIFNNTYKYWNRPVLNFSEPVKVALVVKLASLIEVVSCCLNK